MRRLKPWVFAACLIPLGLLLWRGFTGGLTANPIEYITHRTGDWTLRFLLIALAITPLRRMTGWSGLAQFRRMLGLFAFFYATLHFSTYLVLDFFFAFDLILDDIVERRYVTAGFTGFVLLIPLALTSSQRMIRRLGGERWRRLHRLVYAAATAGVVHYLWLVKLDIRPPMVYAAILAVLLGVRLWFRFARARPGVTSGVDSSGGVPVDADPVR
ncbi:MAG: protein-methionine-sulfoxide reductase heme-binding subunit MsrQ [Vicinamibacterales bacterium]|nr:protein-methionine-sulfoxide reductase heme-binding subunit MsrQ [Vicinamibacterales bacterium]